MSSWKTNKNFLKKNCFYFFLNDGRFSLVILIDCLQHNRMYFKLNTYKNTYVVILVRSSPLTRESDLKYNVKRCRNLNTIIE